MKRSIQVLAPLAFLLCLRLVASRQPGYVGSETCGQCHEDIYRLQSNSNMALTWKEPGKGVFGAGYTRSVQEGSYLHKVYNRDGSLRYSVTGAEGERIDLPIEAITGSNRFGIGFLLRVKEMGGEPLLRPALLEARFMNSKEGGLGISPGHSLFKPTSIESALGRVLSPDFATKCVTCHGSPQRQPTGDAGVGCENCHGPGEAHLKAIEDGGDDPAIQNPAKMSPRQVLQLCSACHAGFSDVRRPRPQDLIISDQVRSLQRSECYIQSDAGFSCLNCHDPHTNARPEDPKYNRTCLSCHAIEAEAAAPCPVNARSQCTACHMPSETPDGLRLTDHWIRVHPETGAGVVVTERVPSHVRPRRLFLRELVTSTNEEAEEARRRIVNGTPFDEEAERVSIAATASLGGFLGELWTEQLATDLASAAAALTPGEISPILSSGSNYKIVQRMPRDFRFAAIDLEERAAKLMQQGNVKGAIPLLEQAVRTDPGFTRALNVLAVAHAQADRLEKAMELLQRSARQAPDEPSTCLLMARALGMADRRSEQLEWLKRAVALDPDGVEGRLQLGAGLFALGHWEAAAREFKAAAMINPLSAPAYYNLSRTEEELGRSQESERLLRIARALEPRLRQ